MNLISAFLKQKWKWLATLMVASFFLYFWLEGPLVIQAPELSLMEELTPYSIPKMVIDEEEEQDHHGIIEIAETEGEGHGLILDKEEEKESFGILISSRGNSDLPPELGEQLLRNAQKLLDGDFRLKLEMTADLFYVTGDGSEKLIYLESSDIIHGITGYAGPINMGMWVTQDGRIKSIHHVSSKETSSYLEKIRRAGYYDQYQKIDLEDEHEVDAISGATLTSEAMAETITALVHHSTEKPLTNFTGIDGLNPFLVEANLNGWWILHLLFISLFFIYGYQKKWKKRKRHMTILSLLSVAYIGFFLNQSFTYVSFIHPFLGTSLSSFVGLYSLLVLLSVVWGKNTYCKYVCPFGNAQRLMVKFAPKKTSKKFFLSNTTIKRIRGIITIGLIVGIFLGMRGWGNYELFPDFFGLEFLSIWMLVTALILLVSVRYPMLWCRMLCPTGSVLDLISDAVELKPIHR
ncbi:FMN-binding protein [bacterium SCSIO 12741]|nr:FMN-binding protein [bacterium SCSIO 12741]